MDILNSNISCMKICDVAEADKQLETGFACPISRPPYKLDAVKSKIMDDASRKLLCLPSLIHQLLTVTTSKTCMCHPKTFSHHWSCYACLVGHIYFGLPC